MATPHINFKVREGRRESGQVIEVLALAPSRRILGVVELIVPLMPGFSLSERIGPDAERAIIDSAKDLARRIAEAVEAPIAEQSQS